MGAFLHGTASCPPSQVPPCVPPPSCLQRHVLLTTGACRGACALPCCQPATSACSAGSPAGLQRSSFLPCLRADSSCPQQERLAGSPWHLLDLQANGHTSQCPHPRTYPPRRPPSAPDTLQLRKNEVLWDEGLAGSLYIQDFLNICADVGFLDPRQLTSRVIEVRC